MTREELKEHCEKQIEKCKLWAKYHHGEELSGKIYEEHKLILELLEQESVLDKIRAELENAAFDSQEIDGEHETIMIIDLDDALNIIDKYRTESED